MLSPSSLARSAVRSLCSLAVAGTQVARDVGIFAPGDPIEAWTFVGQAFFALPDAQQSALLRSGNLVFCRAEPADKQVGSLALRCGGLALSCHALPCLVVPGLIVPCLPWPCPAMPCLALLCLV
jgi:hypothetical protein